MRFLYEEWYVPPYPPPNHVRFRALSRTLRGAGPTLSPAFVPQGRGFAQAGTRGEGVRHFHLPLVRFLVPCYFFIETTEKI